MEAIDFIGPEHEAKHMARYISCPSTIRAHCINNWGRSPDVSRIKDWQAGFRRVAKTVAEPRPHDGRIERYGILPPIKPKPEPIVVAPAPRKAKVKMPKPGPHPWPRWYTPPSKVFVASDLLVSVARAFKFTPDELRGRGRDQRLVRARAVVVRIMRDRKWSLPRIGQVLGGRDHSTIVNLVRNFEIYEGQDETVRAIYEAHREAGWCGNG